MEAINSTTSLCQSPPPRTLKMPHCSDHRFHATLAEAEACIKHRRSSHFSNLTTESRYKRRQLHDGLQFQVGEDVVEQDVIPDPHPPTPIPSSPASSQATIRADPTAAAQNHPQPPQVSEEGAMQLPDPLAPSQAPSRGMPAATAPAQLQLGLPLQPIKMDPPRQQSDTPAAGFGQLLPAVSQISNGSQPIRRWLEGVPSPRHHPGDGRGRAASIVAAHMDDVRFHGPETGGTAEGLTQQDGPEPPAASTYAGEQRHDDIPTQRLWCDNNLRAIYPVVPPATLCAVIAFVLVFYLAMLDEERYP